MCPASSVTEKKKKIIIRTIPRHPTEISLPIFLFLCTVRSILEYIDIRTICRR